MELCERLPTVHGAYGCPREKGHTGECLWYIPWEDGAGLWRVVVYSGTPYDRVKRCRGVFPELPTLPEVHGLLRALSPLRKRELARRTPHSEPEPPWKRLRVRKIDSRWAVIEDVRERVAA